MNAIPEERATDSIKSRHITLALETVVTDEERKAIAEAAKVKAAARLEAAKQEYAEVSA